MTQPQDIEFYTEFAAYCRGKPVDEAYDYWAADDCALIQFLRDTGRQHDRMAGWRIETGSWDIQDALDPDNGELTFSALADRIDALIPERVG